MSVSDLDFVHTLSLDVLANHLVKFNPPRPHLQSAFIFVSFLCQFAGPYEVYQTIVSCIVRIDGGSKSCN